MEIAVNLPSLQGGQDGIHATYNRLQATLDELVTDLRPMISSWSGAAQESFLTCQQQWNEGAQSLATVLNTVSRASVRPTRTTRHHPRPSRSGPDPSARPWTVEERRA